MKTLFIYFKYPFFSGGSYFQEFLNKFAEKTEHIYLLATKYPPDSFINNKKIKIIWLPLVNIKFLEEIIFAFSALFAVIVNKDLHNVDVINSVGPRGLLAGWYLKKRYHIPLVCTIEILNEKGSFLCSLYYELTKFLLKSAPIDQIICWSNYYWEKHLKTWGIPESKVTIIPGGIDLKAYGKNEGHFIKKKYSPNKPLIVFAKPLYPANTKSAEILVRTMAILKPRIKVKLLLGTGPGEDFIRELIKKLAVSDLVDFMPPTSFLEIPNYIAAANLIVLPFLYAPTTSRSLLEAMAAKKPIITSPVGEISKILKNEEQAILVEPKPEILAREIERLLHDHKLSQKIAIGAYLLAKEKFNLDIVIKKTIEVLEKEKKPTSVNVLVENFYKNKLLSKIFHTLIYCLNKELKDCQSVLDLGCGPLSPLKYCSKVDYSVGVEACINYLEQSKKRKIHTKYLADKIQTVSFSPKGFDAVIMIEVLEHLSKTEGEELLDKAENWAKKKVIISTPNGFWPQKNLDGNILQKHLSGWGIEEFRKRGYLVHGLAGVKFLRKESEKTGMDGDLFSPVKFRPKIFWFMILTLSQIFVYYFPKYSFEIFCVKNFSRIEK